MMDRRRKVMYVTGTRADFGLVVPTLQRIAAHPALELQLAVTAMHLSAHFGDTVREIEALGLPIVARVPTSVEERSAASMAQAVGEAVIGLTRAMSEAKPDVVMLLGDRGEMLAGAIAAIHLGIPVAHLHGGERSGTVDEPVRHAITKLAHWHFVATEESRDRVVRLGERAENVFVTGAPGLDGLVELAAMSREDVLSELGLASTVGSGAAHPTNGESRDAPVGWAAQLPTISPTRYVLVLFHPVVQEMDEAASQTRALADGIALALPHDVHIVWLAPNADAGSAGILDALAQLQGERLHRITHLPRATFVAALSHAEALVGNSSAGIIEAASFGTPVVNVGNRQRARERNANTLDCEVRADAIAAALKQALAHGPHGPHGRFPPGNRYGDGHAGERIVGLLATLPIEPALMDKVNTF